MVQRVAKRWSGCRRSRRTHPYAVPSMMFALGAAVALSIATPSLQDPRRPQASTVRDSTPPDSTKRRTPQRKPVTAEAARTAFRDDRARELLFRARAARVAQDSSLRSYDASVRERMTARLGIGQHGPERIMYRQESAYHVTWG